jgi:DNA mismatch repair protein MutS
LANCERFYTEELKQKESLILGAEEKIKNIEFELFQNIVSEVKEKTGDLKNMSHALSQIDCLVSFASVAVDLSWCCPKIKDEGVIDIHNGRHPVVDKILGQGGFVPNDTFMDDSQSQIHIITGPNMSGKSTYIRQVALISLLAHAGSFVPAKRARLDLVDRIFTRVGASDNLATGLSTFMVEMLETANIVNNATSRSLVILDEIGRGTSTFDGISIAWAVTEFLHSKKTIGAKTLFATHYHELTELEKLLSRVVNYNVAVTEKNDKVTFLRKIVPGSTSKSYGIEVARLAGLPQNVIERAEDILTDLESSNDLNTEQSKYSGKNSDFKKTIDPENIKNESDKFHIKEKIKKQVKNENPEIDQLILFKTKIDPVIEELNQIDLMKVSPLQSLNFLFYLQKKIKGQPIPSPLPLSKGRSKIKFQETIQDQLNLKLF